MRAGLLPLLTAMILTATSAIADRLVVVELFTSQGCSSCPPADELLAELADREDVLPLALHVDYWDYIGWRDVHADPAFTKRQKAYAHAAGAHSVYTPQMVVDGQMHIVGYKPMKLAMALRERMAGSPVAKIATRRDGNRVEVVVEPTGRSAADCVVSLVRYTPSSTTKIERGENAGRTITYRNIVTAISPLGNWDGTSRFTRSVPVSAGGNYAVLVQHKNAGPILGAARVASR